MSARFRPVRALLRRLADAEHAAAAPLLGLIFLILIGCIGLAIDTGRSMVVKARLTNALDAAGLAVGARVATSNYQVDAKKFVSANFKANYAGATVTEVTATPNSDKTVITLAATATMPTAFMKLFGTQVVTVKATSEVTRASAGLELVMVLDNTGSMSDSMSSLKSAANNLVNILYGDSSTSKNLYVGLVPFSQGVNIGTARKAWVTPSSLLAATNPYYPDQWLGCVEDRASGLDQTDDPPSSSDAKTLFKSYYAANETYNAYYYPNTWISRSWLGRETTNINYNATPRPLGPGSFCPAELTPLTNTKATVQTGISNMKAVGSTMVNLGAVWGWRMLSPRWRGSWPGEMTSSGLPLDYNSKNMTKAVVLMTDGENSFAAGNYTAYGYLADAKLGSSNQSSAEKALDTRLSTVCTSMKAKGIFVYTVAFNITDAATKTLLQSCATSTSYYFDAGNSSALVAAFQTIGSSLSQLRVSK